MFADAFKFYTGYTIPAPAKHKTLEDYRNFIEALPITDSPETFGLHTNADITWVFLQSSLFFFVEAFLRFMDYQAGAMIPNI